MIQKQSNDPDVAAAAAQAEQIIATTLQKIPPAEHYDYGGHNLKIGEYGVCERCTRAIAEAQAAEATIRTEMDLVDDPTIREHLELAAQLFRAEAEAAKIRAELHNGQGTEGILNNILGFLYERQVHDDYHHSHQGGSH